MVLEKLSESLKNTLQKIAKSLFVDEKLINELIKQYKQSKKMVKMFKGNKGDMSKLMKKFGGKLPMGG